MMATELIFIYNAKSGLFNKATDFAHKIVSPQTYNCSLCSLIYGNFSVHKKWAKFISSLNVTVRFLYKNDFEKLFPNEETVFPAVYLNERNGLTRIITAPEISDQEDLINLINLLKKKLKLNANK